MVRNSMKVVARADKARTTVWSKLTSDRLLPGLLLSPTLLTLGVVTLFPIVFGLVITFTDWRLTEHGFNFVGFRNYTDTILRDADFHHSVYITALFTALAVFISLVLGLAIALLFSQELKGGKIARSIVLLPMMMTPIVVGFNFMVFFNADYGPVNWILMHMHLMSRPIAWRGEPWPAFFVILATETWMTTPVVILILIAGITSLPTEPFEAAVVDGASAWQQFWRIGLPLLRGPLMVAIMLRIILATRTFDTLVLLTNGGPGIFTQFLGLQTYRVGLGNGEIGRGSTLAVLTVIVSLAFIAVALWLLSWSGRTRRAK